MLGNLHGSVDVHAGHQCALGVVQHHQGGHRLAGARQFSEARDFTLLFGAAERGSDRDGRAHINRVALARKNGQLGPHDGGVQDREQSSAAGLLADIRRTLGHGPADRCGDVEGLQAFVTLDGGQHLALPHDVTHRCIDGANDAVEARADAADAGRIRHDPTENGERLFDGRGTRHFCLKPEGFSHLGADARAALEAVVFPMVLPALVLGVDRNLEGMGFVDDGVTAQEIALGREVDLVPAPAEACQCDVQLGVHRVHGLAAVADPGPVLRRHAGLEDGQLDRQITVHQQPSAVGPFFRFLPGGCAVRMTVVGRSTGRRRTVAGTEKPQQNGRHPGGQGKISHG